MNGKGNAGNRLYLPFRPSKLRRAVPRGVLYELDTQISQSLVSLFEIFMVDSPDSCNQTVIDWVLQSQY